MGFPRLRLGRFGLLAGAHKLGKRAACAEAVNEQRVGVINHVVLIGARGFNIHRRPVGFPWLRLILQVGSGGRHCWSNATGLFGNAF